jgi:hypothetical protein
LTRLVAAAFAAALVAAGPAAAAAPVSVATSVSPRWLYFADTITARVDVVFDPRRVDAGSIRLQPSFASWDQIAPERSSSSVDASVGRRSWSFRLACLSLECLTRGRGIQGFRIRPVLVTARTRGGADVVVRRGWPVLYVTGRFNPAATSGLRPVFRLSTVVPAATYRTSPSGLALALDLVGALVLALALGFGALEFVRWRASRRTVAAVPPLVRALALVRQAKARDADDRRRAASLLARTLPSGRDGLTSTAAEVAWSPAEPDPGQLEELAQAVEQQVEESS